VDHHLKESEHSGGEGNILGISIEYIRYDVKEELF
jgi:hypothetical protein